jgi:adenylate cyclase
MERKLATILCADVAGYSRLMGEDEAATLTTLTRHRKIIDSLIEEHRGRFVNSAGDSVLAEFASVVNAVECAIRIQTVLEAQNAGVPSQRRMEFRIGVNLGDVKVEGDQIYGDGVNVAARLESLAEPGGICISGKVHDEIASKLTLSCLDAGAQRVKNIAEPVRVWRVLVDGTPGRSHWRVRGYWRPGMFSIAGLAIVLVTFVVVQHLSLRPQSTRALIPAPVKPALTLPDKPSIAVLPFTNISGEREQEYFSDGITDDLITDLSRLPGLFLIARESSFTYKGKAARLQDVGRELGVKYVLEGSVCKAAQQVRITVQLADTTTGDELWAERYDRPLRDVFALQDEIVRRIVTTLKLQIELSQEGIVIPRSTGNLEAYDDVLRGTEYLAGINKEANLKARQMFERAIAPDPGYAAAYALLGGSYFQGWVLSLDSDSKGLERALEAELKAITLDDSLAVAHGVLAGIYVQKAQNQQALTEAQRGIALDGNSADSYFWLDRAMINQFRPSEALVAAEKAARLNPFNAGLLCEEGFAYSQLERWEQAIPPFKSCLRRYPDHLWGHTELAIDDVKLGDRDDAQLQTAQVEQLVTRTPSAMGYAALALVLNYEAPAKALTAAQSGLGLDRQNRQALLQESFAHFQLGQWADAGSAMKRYVTLYPDDIWGHAWLAGDYGALGAMDAARAQAAEVERLAVIEPGASGFVGLAEAMNNTGRPAEALRATEKAAQLEPGFDCFYEQGRAYTQLGRWNDAAPAMRNFLARNPEQVWPRLDLAVDYIELGKADIAAAEVAEILKLDPKFSREMGVKGEFPAYQARAAADLSKAGLK